ncbi:hypothetical protein A0J61_10228, partial [Choanephora cucurbitarum]
MIRKYVNGALHRWDDFVNAALWAARIRTHTTTGYSPFFLTYVVQCFPKYRTYQLLTLAGEPLQSLAHVDRLRMVNAHMSSTPWYDPAAARQQWRNMKKHMMISQWNALLLLLYKSTLTLIFPINPLYLLVIQLFPKVIPDTIDPIDQMVSTPDSMTTSVSVPLPLTVTVPVFAPSLPILPSLNLTGPLIPSNTDIHFGSTLSDDLPVSTSSDDNNSTTRPPEVIDELIVTRLVVEDLTAEESLQNLLPDDDEFVDAIDDLPSALSVSESLTDADFFFDVDIDEVDSPSNQLNPSNTI